MEELSLKEDFLSEALIQVGKRCARAGLYGKWKEECEQTFVVRWVNDTSEPPVWMLPPMRQAALLSKAARNHVLNFVRDLTLRARRERPLESLLEQRAAAGSPQEMLMKGHFWDEIDTALQRLTPAQRTLFIRVHFYGDTIEEIARQTGRTIHAVTQSLYTARRRLRAILIEMGYVAATLFELLPPEHSAGSGRRVTWYDDERGDIEK